MDEFLSMLLIDFLAQAIDVNLNQVGFCIKAIRPYVFDDDTPAHGFRRANHQQFQERQFLCGQRYLLTRAGHNSPLPVELEVRALQLLVPSPPGYGANTSLEFIEREWFCQIVVSAC